MLCLRGLSEEKLNGILVKQMEQPSCDGRVTVELLTGVSSHFPSGKHIRVRSECLIECKSEELFDTGKQLSRTRMLFGHDLRTVPLDRIDLNRPTVESECKIQYRKNTKTVYKQSIMCRLVLGGTEMKFLIFLTSEAKGSIEHLYTASSKFGLRVCEGPIEDLLSTLPPGIGDARFERAMKIRAHAERGCGFEQLNAKRILEKNSYRSQLIQLCKNDIARRSAQLIASSYVFFGMPVLVVSGWL